MELDSSSAVALINNAKNCRNPLAALLGRIERYLLHDCDVKVHHVFCEANRAADFMASKGHELQLGLTVFYDPPLGLCSILKEDIRGVSFLRMIVLFVGCVARFIYQKIIDCGHLNE